MIVIEIEIEIVKGGRLLVQAAVSLDMYVKLTFERNGTDLYMNIKTG